MFHTNFKRQVFISLVLILFFVASTGINQDSSAALARKNNKQETKNEQSFSQTEMMELIKTLTNTISRLDSRIENLENKITQIEIEENENSVAKKWENFSKPSVENDEITSISVEKEVTTIKEKDIPAHKEEIVVISSEKELIIDLPEEKGDKISFNEQKESIKESNSKIYQEQEANIITVKQDIKTQKPAEKPQKLASKETRLASSAKASSQKTEQPPKNQAKENFKYNIAVEKYRENNYDVGSVSIGGMKVIAYRSDAGGYSSYERAKIVAKRLEKLLDSGKDLKELHPAVSNGFYVGSVDGDIIFTVDDKTANRSGLNNNALTVAWVNNLRRAFGLPKVQRNASISTSRGLDASGRPEEMIFERQELTQNSQIINMLLPVAPVRNALTLMGQASWYGPYFHGRRAADGSRFNMHEMTAAHKSLPFGTVVKVTNLNNNKECVVRITDRGPFIHGRIIDLSRAAAQQIGMLGSGVANVKVEVIGKK
jgi:rare lipoprotein A (peptidoglycan hydrolase)